jgi:hypothetical protein
MDEQRAALPERFDERSGAARDDLRERLVFLDDHDDVRRTRECRRAGAFRERDHCESGDDGTQHHGIE